MLIFLLLACFVVLWWLVYKFTIYALPCVVGISAGRFAYQTDAGGPASYFVGIVAAFSTLVVLRSLYHMATSPPLRMLLAALFVGPSVVVGYNVFDDLASALVPSAIWRHALSVSGAAVAGLLAYIRLSEPAKE